MRKFFPLLCLLVLLAIPTHAEASVEVVVNGEILQSDTRAEIVEDRTYVPLRAIAEKLGAQVVWNEKTQGIKLILGEMQTDLTIGSLSASITKGQKVTAESLEAAPYIKNDRTYVPLRFVSRGLGCGIYWCDEIKTAIVYSNHPAPEDNLKALAEGFFNTDLPQAVKTDNARLAQSIKEAPEEVCAYFANLWTQRALNLAAECFSEEEREQYLSLAQSPEKQYEYLKQTAAQYAIAVSCPVKMCAVENNGEFAVIIDAPVIRTADLSPRMVLLSKDEKILSIHF